MPLRCTSCAPLRGRAVTPQEKSQQVLLAQMREMNAVTINVVRVAVLLDALCRALAEDVGWEYVQQAYDAQRDVPQLRWPDGQLERTFVAAELQAAADILAKLQTMAQLAALHNGGR
jgi:hypothetical protein